MSTYRSGHSTAPALVAMTDQWLGKMAAEFCSLILLQNFIWLIWYIGRQGFGVKDIALNWVKYYLKHGRRSKFIPGLFFFSHVQCSVSQGSWLGTHHLIHKNDFPHILSPALQSLLITLLFLQLFIYLDSCLPWIPHISHKHSVYGFYHSRHCFIHTDNASFSDDLTSHLLYISMAKGRHAY